MQFYLKQKKSYLLTNILICSHIIFLNKLCACQILNASKFDFLLTQIFCLFSKLTYK